MHTNYIISLPTAIQRREHIKQEFGKQDIPFEFYDALMPSEQLNQLIQKYLPNLSQASLSEGEKACFMGHYILWQKCIDENLPYIFIFEDDILLGENAYHFLAQDKWIEEIFNEIDEYILRFETFLNYSKCKDIGIPSYLNRNILKLIVENCGTAGYIISSKAIVNLTKFINSLNSEELCAIDLIMFNKFNRCTYQLSPALCIQENQLELEHKKLSSQLSKERDISHKNRKNRTIFELLKSLYNKPRKIYRKKYKDKFTIPFK